MPTEESLQEVAEYYSDYFDSHEFLSMLSVEVDTVEEGHVAFRIPFNETFSNPSVSGGKISNPIQGGIVATVIDIAGGPAVRTLLDNPTEYYISTVNLNISYLRPTRGDIIVHSDCLQAGSSIGFCYISTQCEREDGELEETACALGTFHIASK